MVIEERDEKKMNIESRPPLAPPKAGKHQNGLHGPQCLRPGRAEKKNK
jgi:hypothetical protein